MENISAFGVWDVLDKQKKDIYQSRDANGFMPSRPDWQERWKEALKNGNK